MKIFAGCELYFKKPSSDPITAMINVAIASLSCCRANITNGAKAKKLHPAARPSMPSVRLTALDAPVNMKNTKSIYSPPNGITHSRNGRITSVDAF